MLTTRLIVAVDHSKKEALEAPKIVEDKAKRAIGTYDYGWSPPAGSTQAERVAQGHPANEPLLRTDEPRDSIEQKPVPENEAELAVYHELGS